MGVTEVLAAPLAALVAVEHQARPSPEVVARWDLPDADREALLAWGLPTGQMLTPGFQTAAAPLLVPNAAGPRERRLIAPDQRLYELGRWGSNHRAPKLGAVAGDGRVLAIRPAPFTADDLPSPLREHYRGLNRPAVALVNSSVTRLVALAWRWRAAARVLGELHAAPFTGSAEREYARLEAIEMVERSVRAAVARTDPAIHADDPGAPWIEAVTSL